MQEFTGKMLRASWISRPRPTLLASLRNRNARQHCTRAILCEKLQVKCRRPKARPTLRASLRSRHALGHFTSATLCVNLQKKMPADQLEHPDQAPAFTLTVRTPQCGHTVWRTKTIGSAWLPRGTLLNLLDWWMVSIGGFLFGLIISLFPPGKPLHSHIFSFRRRPGTMLRSN